MANCPKCDYKLRIRDYKPECPNCGINLVYYGMEERLAREADAAEKEHAEFQPKMDRLKASVYGSNIAIARIILCFVPILALLLPLGKISLNLPFFESARTTTISLISIVQYLMNADFGFITGMLETEMFKSMFLYFIVSLVLLILTLVIMLAHLVVLPMSCSPKGFVRNITVSVLGIISFAGSVISFYLMNNEIGKFVPSDIYTGSISPGIAGVFVAFAALLFINILYKVLKIEVKYTDVSELLKPFEQRQQEARDAAEADAVVVPLPVDGQVADSIELPVTVPAEDHPAEDTKK